MFFVIFHMFIGCSAGMRRDKKQYQGSPSAKALKNKTVLLIITPDYF